MRQMMLLVAVCAAGMVHAVTWSWSAVEQTHGSVNLESAFISAPNTTVTYAAVLHGGISDVNTKSILMQLDSTETAGFGVNLEVEGGKIQSRPMKFASGGVATVYDRSLNEGANAFAIQLVRGEGTAITMNFYLNGELLQNWVVASGTDVSFDRLSWGQNSGGNNSNGGLYSVAMTTDAITAEDITVPVLLPEPTALALLALGVAGLAVVLYERLSLDFGADECPPLFRLRAECHSGPFAEGFVIIAE